MKGLFASFAVALALAGPLAPAAIAQPAYFTRYDDLRMTRTPDGVLTVEMNTAGGPLKFTAHDHETFVDAFYDIGRDRDNKVVILAGAGGQWMSDIDFQSFGDVSDPNVWSRIHDDGTQMLENIANVRAPMICAVEGKAWVHTEWCLLANLIIAGEGASFNDVPHFKGGIVPGDGLFTLWSYYVGAGRAQAMLLDPQPLDASTAKQWGVVSEIVPAGQAVSRAREVAATWLTKPEATRRFTRLHFVQPIKQRVVAEVGYGLALEGISASALVKQLRAKSQ
jgi:enoyl-CoA hydratase/carnithine racemase